MTTKTKPRTPRLRQKAPIGIQRTAERVGIAKNLTPWQLSGPPFDGGEDLRQDSTAADLFDVVFEGEAGPDGLLDGAIQCALDDFEIIEYAMADEENLAPLVRRFARRANWRLKVAIEVDRRMRAAEPDRSAYMARLAAAAGVSS